MQTTTYHGKLRFAWKDERLLLPFSFLNFLIGLNLAFNRASGWPPFAAWGAYEITIFTLSVFAFVTAALGIRIALLPNSLQLDKDGLTYKRTGLRSAWPWRDISTFTLVRGWWRPRIEFTVSVRHDRGWRRYANLRKTKAGWTGTIPNIWDTPLEDIAATLNEYRERALGGENAAGGGAQAPRPYQRRMW